MSDEIVGKNLPFLKYTTPERKEQFLDYFKNCPSWLIEVMKVEKIKKNTIFAREGDNVETVCLVLAGTVKATDYRVHGIHYDYMFFTKVYAYGSMEIIMDLEKYLTTLQAVSDCTLLRIPRGDYERWIKSDIKAIYNEAKLISEYLLEQNQNTRAFLFLQGKDRLAYLLMKRYEKYAEKGIFCMRGDRQELADSTGMCLKTISRSIKKLSEEGFITKEDKYIVVNSEQYAQMKELIAKILVDNG